MSNMNLGAAASSNLSNQSAYSVDPKQVDGVTDAEETYWQNFRWTKQWGYFNAVADLKSALLMKSIWNVGKGYTADTDTKVILEHITGWGKDTFDDILFNMDVIKRVGGDSYAEIIRDPDTELIVNLKPLDPGSMRIVVDRQGRIKRYEQTNKTGATQPIIKFKPEEILHLSNNRLADQIHGISDIDAVEKTILADEQLFDDINKVMHRQAKPMIMFKLGTDDTTQISNFISKMDNATQKGENIYIPNDTNTVDYEVVEVNVSAMLLAWGDNLRNKFYRTIGLPQVVPGAGGQSTESESKVIYLAFEQIVEKEQRQLEEQLWQQLTLRIDLNPPTSISQPLQADTSKDGAMQQMNMQPSDMQVGAGR